MKEISTEDIYEYKAPSVYAENLSHNVKVENTRLRFLGKHNTEYP